MSTTTNKPSPRTTITVTAEVAAKHKLPAPGSKIWNQGHEFTVTEPMLYPVMDQRGPYTHQFNYQGVCTEDVTNDSIRKTGYNGARYGFGVTIREEA